MTRRRVLCCRLCYAWREGTGTKTPGQDHAMSNLHTKALVSLLLLFLAMAGLLFIPPWTFDYWQAWTFLAVYFVASALITLYLMKKDPQLLARRMSGGPAAEKEPAQRIIMSLASLGYIGLLVIPALDRRFAWSQMPPGVALAGDALVALGFLGIFFVFRENTFTSAIIELAADQKVIRPGRTRWCAIRCTRRALSCFAASRLRLAPCGACSSSWPFCRRCYGDCLTKKNSSPKICRAIGSTRAG
jgi:hypothetical protein